MFFHFTEGEHPESKIIFPKHLLELSPQRQTIIHGFAPGLQKIRIRPDTHLLSWEDGIRANLLFHFGIPMYPKLKEGVDQVFVLIFEGLPEDCEYFHLLEKPFTVGVFQVKAISRTPEDVYSFTFG